jgi:two-component sensor histidine kinase
MAVTTVSALLSRIPGSTRVCVGTYLRDLCADLAKASGRSGGPQLTCAAVDAALPIGTVITLGLIADLLITSVFVDAFRLGSAGRVTVSFTAGPKGWQLTVEDSGVAVQAEDKRRDNGLIIVRLLISRLGGCLEVPESIKGTRCIVTVPRPACQA